MDALKAPFKKLSEKAKKFVAEKAEEILSKVQNALKNVTGAAEYQKFLSQVEKEEGGESLDGLLSASPDYAKLQKEAEDLKTVEASSLMPSGESAAATKKESFDLATLRTSLLLIDESYLQRQEATSKSLLRESLIMTIAGGWWASVKGVVATCGLLGWSARTIGAVCDKLGFKSAGAFFKKADHFFHHVEEAFLSKVAFPKPVQYAAYRALAGVKGVIDKKKGKEKTEALDYKAFSGPEGKEERDATIKALHTAIVMVLVVDAITHVFHALTTFVKSIATTASDLAHAAGHAGVEASNLTKIARGAATAAGEALGGTKSLSGQH